MKYAIMKKKEDREATFCLAGSSRFTIKSHVAYINIFKGDHVKKIKNPDQHTLTPVQPDNRSVLARIIFKFINKKKIQQDK